MTGEENKRVYGRYTELSNARDFASLPEVVNPGRYREIFVGFTPGWGALPEAVASLEKVVGGIPDLNARIDNLVSQDDKVYARLTVTGTNTGRFFGAPLRGEHVRLRPARGRQNRRAHPAVRYPLPAPPDVLRRRQRGAGFAARGAPGCGPPRPRASVNSSRPGRDANLGAWTS